MVNPNMMGSLMVPKQQQNSINLDWGQFQRKSNKISEKDPDDLPVMNNSRLDKFSSKYTSDKKETIEQKCFFLFAGKDLQKG